MQDILKGFNAYSWHSEASLVKRGFPQPFIYELDDSFVLVDTSARYFGGYIIGKALEQGLASADKKMQLLEPIKVANCLEISIGKIFSAKTGNEDLVKVFDLGDDIEDYRIDALDLIKLKVGPIMKSGLDKLETDSVLQLYLETKHDVYKTELFNRIYEHTKNRLKNKMQILLGLPGFDKEDLESEMNIGIIAAIEKFDPGKNASLKTYAYIRAKGAIMDFIREQDFISREERTVGSKIIKRTGMSSDGNTDKVMDELSAELGISKRRLIEIKRLNEEANICSIETTAYSSDEKPIHLSDMLSDNCFEEDKICDSMILSDAIRCLSWDGKKIIHMYYKLRLTEKEIGMELGVTKSRASQLLEKAINKLRKNPNIDSINKPE